MIAAILPDWAIDLLKAGANVTSAAVGTAFDLGQSAAGAVQNFFGFGQQTLPQSQTVAADLAGIPIGTSVQQSNEFNIVASDPQATANAVADRLQRQQEEAQAQFRRGGS